MASPVTLFAWATPAFFSGAPVDHTWVTDFDNQAHNYPDANAVAAAGANYWFCWGGYHAHGGTPGNPTGFLGRQAGTVPLAKCLVQANADSNTVPAARGTIYSYGVDGVCHQLANQVLYATGASGAQLTVRRARGYMASTFLYGTYGKQHSAWAAKIQSCSQAIVAAARGEVSKMAMAPDEFEEHARLVLGDKDAALLQELLSLRDEARRSVPPKLEGGPEQQAEALNAANQAMLDKAAAILGAEKFERIFGYPAGTKIDLVDPSVQRQSRPQGSHE